MIGFRPRVEPEAAAGFTRADAEAAGWRFMEPRPEEMRDLGGGLVRRIDAEHRAEIDIRHANTTFAISQPSEERLLAAIEAWIEHGRNVARPGPVQVVQGAGFAGPGPGEPAHATSEGVIAA